LCCGAFVLEQIVCVRSLKRGKKKGLPPHGRKPYILIKNLPKKGGAGVHVLVKGM